MIFFVLFYNCINSKNGGLLMGKGNHRSINAEGSSGKVRKTISGSLLKILLPITAVSIIIIILFLSSQA